MSHATQSTTSNKGPNGTFINFKDKKSGVRSGGSIWSQYLISNSPKVWYLADDRNTNQDKFLIPNRCVSIILGVNRKSLSELKQADSKLCTVHTDCPSYFYESTGGPSIRNSQLMWTLAGMFYLLEQRRVRAAILRGDSMFNYETIVAWLREMQMAYSAVPANIGQLETSNNNNGPQLELALQHVATPDVTTLLSEESEAKEDPSIRAEANLRALLTAYWEERNRRRELEARVSELQDKLEQLTLKTKQTPVDKNMVQSLTAAAFKKGINLSAFESLSNYVARVGQFRAAEDLTKIGLLNSDQIYSLFASKWTDPCTGKLIHKARFQEVLRKVFHLPHSDHRTPILKAEAVRRNMAIVCQVACKKKPNPVDDAGQILEKDNPAYLASPEPCVRFQTRYSSKAIDYLSVNWHKLTGV